MRGFGKMIGMHEVTLVALLHVFGRIRIVCPHVCACLGALLMSDILLLWNVGLREKVSRRMEAVTLHRMHLDVGTCNCVCKPLSLRCCE